MMRAAVCVCAMLLAREAWPADQPPVLVLDGPEVQPLRDGLQRAGCDFADLKSLDEPSLAGCRVLVIGGTQPPIDEAGKRLIAQFVEAGGSVFATGGGARCLIDLKLLDAAGYYLTGTTLHNTHFDGYHRLIFGYPGAEPPTTGTTSGVSFALRATNGPLMELGPAAVSILGAGGGYSLAAIQRLGKGRLLAVGFDPQGGQFFSDLDKSRLMPGNELKTDRLLANALAFLLDPHCNLVPNSGFEELTDLTPAQSHWEVSLRAGAQHEWCQTDAAEGKVYLKLIGPEAKASAEACPLRPIVVEPGQSYCFGCQYRSTAAWKISWQWWKKAAQPEKDEAGPLLTVPASADWQRFTTQIAIPTDVPYARPIIRFAGLAELCLDDVTLQLAPSVAAGSVNGRR